MIKRYSLKKVTDIFSDSSKYRNWLKIEILLVRYLVKKGFLEEKKAERLIADLTVLPHKVREEEKKVNHDVVAFVNHISDSTVLPEKKWIHFGLTSSDLVDTGNSMAFKEVNEEIFNSIGSLMKRIKQLSFKHRKTYKVKRKNLFIEGLESFGCRFAQVYSDLQLAIDHFAEIRKSVEVVSLSGSVGNCSYLDPGLQNYVAKELGLFSSLGSTQVLSRTRYYSYFSVLNSIGQIINSLSVDLRILCRTEIGEVSEGFTELQIGSSSMPHKKNPITLENICGLFRLLRGYTKVSEENVAIWFERDISHSSVDRVLFLDAITVFLQIVKRMDSFLRKFSIHSDVMLENIEKNAFNVFKGYVRNFLLEKGKFFDAEIDNFMAEIEKHTSSIKTMKQAFMDVGLCKKFKDYEIDKLFDIDEYFKHVDVMYENIFKDQSIRFNFHNIYFENFRIKRAIDLLASELNYFYKDSKDPVRIVGIKDDCVVFLSHLLMRLKFPILLKTVDLNLFKWEIRENVKKISKVELGFDKDFFKNKRILVVDALFDRKEVIDLMSDNLKKYDCSDISFCSLFLSSDEEILKLIDFYGLILPCNKDIAGFGIDLNGIYKNISFLGKVKN